MRLLTAAAMVALLLVAVAPEASGKGGGTPITACGQVVMTNAFLTQDMYCPASDGVVVGADNVTVDLKGFTLRGDLSNGHFGIDDQAGFDQLTVKNGVVRNFAVGVEANTGDKVAVSNLVASGNTAYGIAIIGDVAKVQSATAAGNGLDGILVSGDNASIQTSASTGNGRHGIDVEGDKPQLKGNRADANGFQGGASDLAGLGIYVSGFTIPPAGTNTARGNDDPAECNPAALC